MTQTTLRPVYHLPKRCRAVYRYDPLSDMVEEQTGVRISVEVLLGGQMSEQREIIESVQINTLKMGYDESGLSSNYVPAFGVLTLPYLYGEPQHGRDIGTGEIGSDLTRHLEGETGLVVPTRIQAGYRDTCTVDRVIETPEDFQNMSIRMPESPVFVEAFRTLAA